MIAEKIKAIRKALGLSQSKFAKLIGCPTKSLANWEQGIREPKGAMMMKILEVQPTRNQL